MQKKSIYDDLLSYKVQSDDIKIIADTLIFTAQNNIKISLEEIIKLHQKKIDIKKMYETLQKAVSKNITVDLQPFIKSDLGKEGFGNFFEGWIYAKIMKIETNPQELRTLAEAKVNIINFIDNFILLSKTDNNISVNDFTKCRFCLYSQDKFFQTLSNIKKLNSNISLKQILNTKLQPYELDEIFTLYKKLSTVTDKISFEDLALLKTQKYNVKNIVEAVALAHEQKINVTRQTIIEIAKKGHNIKEILELTYKQKSYTIKPVSVILKSGIEVLLKVNILIKADLENFLTGMTLDFMNLKIIELLKSNFGKYSEISDIYQEISKISETVLQNINKLNPAYKVIAISIDDIDIGRIVAAEIELKKIQIEQKINDTKAKIFQTKTKPQITDNENQITH